MSVPWPTSLKTLIAAVIAVTFSACQCGPVDLGEPDADVEVPDSGPSRRDAGRPVVIPQVTPDAGWPQTYASEPCPDELMAAPAGAADADVRFGICIVLHTLTADAKLDGVPETKPIITQLVSGNAELELTQTPTPSGELTIKAMRGRYDILRHQPGGVWPNFEGFIDHGSLDLTSSQVRSFAANTHLLRGAVRFGGLPFTPTPFPHDVTLQAYGAPQWQRSAVTSRGGAYELRMVEGSMGVYLSSPAQALFGTELSNFPLTPTLNLTLDRDQELDIDIPSSVLEGTLTVDGAPFPDARQGYDWSITYTKPGDAEASVRSRHEGGLSAFSALVPKATYGASLDFDGVPNRSFPSRIFGMALQGGIDLNQDSALEVALSTVKLEGSIVIDGVPPRPNPNYNFQLYLFGVANQQQTRSFHLYEVPLDSASFNLRAFRGNYFTVLSLDDGLAEDLAGGFWVVDRFLQVSADRSLPITIETGTFHGKLLIDGKAPVPNKRAGTITFRNRAIAGQYSWFTKGLFPAEDGSFTVRLPKGEYEVFFTIDSETYPTYASGRFQMIPRIALGDSVNVLDYKTITIRGPLRVDDAQVEDTLAGPEVGLRMQRKQDLEVYTWNHGRGAEYELHVPAGSYSMEFVVYENALNQVAWGHAQMGLELNIARPGEPLMSFLR